MFACGLASLLDFCDNATSECELFVPVNINLGCWSLFGFTNEVRFSPLSV